MRAFDQADYERRIAAQRRKLVAEIAARDAAFAKWERERRPLDEKAQKLYAGLDAGSKPWNELSHEQKMGLIKSMQRRNPHITAEEITSIFQRNPNLPAGTVMMNIVTDSVLGFLPALATAGKGAGTSAVEGLKTVLSPEFRKALGSDLAAGEWTKRVAAPFTGAIEGYYSKHTMGEVGKALNSYLKDTGQGGVKLTKAAFEQFDGLMRQLDHAANTGDTKSIANVVDKIAADTVLTSLLGMGMAKGGELATRGLTEMLSVSKLERLTDAVGVVNKAQDVRGYVTTGRDIASSVTAAGRSTDPRAGDPALAVAEGKGLDAAKNQVATTAADAVRNTPSMLNAREGTAIQPSQYGEFGYRASEVKAIAAVANRHDVQVDMRPGNVARLNWQGQLLKDEPIKTKTITADEVNAGLFPKGSEGAAGYLPQAQRPSNYGSLPPDQQRLWDSRISEHHAQADAMAQLEQGVKLRVTTDDGKSRELLLQAKPDASGVIRSTGGDFKTNLVFTGDNDIMALRHADGRLFYTDKNGIPIKPSDLELDLPVAKRSDRALELGEVVSADRAKSAQVFRELQADKATGVLHPGGFWDTDYVKVKYDKSSVESLLTQQLAALEAGDLATADKLQQRLMSQGDTGIAKSGLNAEMKEALAEKDTMTAKRLNSQMKKKAKGIPTVDCTSHKINLKTWEQSRANGGKAGIRIGPKGTVTAAHSDPHLKPKLGSYDPTSRRTKAFSSTPRLTRK